MSIATAIQDLKDRVEDAYDALEEKGATIPATKNTYNLPDTIGTIQSGGGSKYGVPIDGMLGDVDQNGQLGLPTETFSFTSNDTEEVGDYVLIYKFYGNNGITSLSLPNLTQVNQYGMSYICNGCSNLTSVDLSSLTSIGSNGLSYAFYGCTSLASVDLSSLSSITGSYGMSSAFRNCSSLVNVDLSSLSSITGQNGMSYAFTGCTSLTSVDLSSLSSITGPNGMSYIFSGCTSLASIDLSSLSSITGSYGMYYAFHSCTSLTSVDLSSLESITSGSQCLYGTFTGCTSLKNVKLNKLSNVSSTTYWDNMFNGCTALEKVDFSEATAIPQLSTTTFANTNSTFKIIVPDDLYQQWRNATNWSSYVNQIEAKHTGVEFKALEANSTVSLNAVGSPDAHTFEYRRSADDDWTPYVIGTTLTLSNVGDVVYMRNTSTSIVSLGKSETDYYNFQMTGLIEANGELSYLNMTSGIGDNIYVARSYCYYKLFSGCTALTKAPKFYKYQANYNAPYAFAYMFEGCTNLEEEPENFETNGGAYGYESIRSNYLYKGMFKGCTSLEKVELGFRSLINTSTYTSDGAFEEMFDGCSSLNEIKLPNYGGTFDTTHFNNWVRGVASTGTFKWNGTDTTTGDYAIPTGWTIQDAPYGGLTFVAREANSTVSMAKNGSAPNVTLYYSTDKGVTWSYFTIGTTTVTLANVGDRVSFRASGTNTAFSDYNGDAYIYFVCTGKVALEGNINSLLNRHYETVTSISNNYSVFRNLFKNNTGIVDAENLTLPATTINFQTYGSMFEGCTNLVNPPKELPATNFIILSGSQPHSYARMFYGCTSLVKSPHIESQMIGKQPICTNMFDGCSSLQEIKVDFTGTFFAGYFTDWVSGVPSTGTFYYNGSDTTRGVSAIPTGWTITPFTAS